MREIATCLAHLFGSLVSICWFRSAAPGLCRIPWRRAIDDSLIEIRKVTLRRSRIIPISIVGALRLQSRKKFSSMSGVQNSRSELASIPNDGLAYRTGSTVRKSVVEHHLYWVVVPLPGSCNCLESSSGRVEDTTAYDLRAHSVRKADVIDDSGCQW